MRSAQKHGPTQGKEGMRKVILNLAVSLDGYIAGPHGEYDWCMTDQDYGMKEFMREVDAALIGRKTYDLMRQMGEEAHPGLTNYVFSRTIEGREANDVVFVSQEAAEFVRTLKSSEGKALWLFGGGELIEALFQADLVDELMLSVHPLTLGDGKPLFPRMQTRLGFTLRGTREYSTGLVQLLYARSRQ